MTVADKDILRLTNKMHIVEDEATLHILIKTLSNNTETRRIGFVNAHAVNMFYNDKQFYQDVMACDYILRDGSGMKMLFDKMDKNAGLNLNGTDLIPQIINAFKGQPIALLGTQSPFLDNAATKIKEEDGVIALQMDGFKNNENYVEAVKQAKPALIILGMGMPKQERVAALLAQEIEQPATIICGGAILDFMGGKVKRAPKLFRDLGIEWVYRLLSEPKRLFKRYVIGNGVFLIRAKRIAKLKS